MGLAVGIDLGTTNSVVAIATPTGVEFALGPAGERVHPSVVGFQPDGSVVVGLDAKHQRVDFPTTTVYSAKRLIGQNVRAPLVQLALTGLPFPVEEGPNQQPVIVIDGRRVTVPEVSGHVLAHLKACAQRQATKEAGRLAGLEVLRLLNEPTAAALAYGFGQHKDETVCVFDFGGGTFDVSLLAIKDEVFEVLATDGDFFLGGDDIDRAVAEFLAAELNRQLRVDPRGDPALMTRLAIAAEAIKIHLSEATAAEGTVDGLLHRGRSLSLPFRLTRPQLDELIRGYVDRTIELTRNVLTTAGLEPRAITEVVCVGGSTRVPLVRRRLAELFGREPALRINPDEVVAQGAAIQAGSLSGALYRGGGMATRDAVPTAALSPLAHGDVPWAQAAAPARPILLDVTPATLRIATAGGYSEPILDKNLPTPIERTRVFTTAHDQQRRVVIECGRGEHKRFAENEPLGTLVLDDLPPRRRGEVKIEVTFRVDTDGILHVRARDADTGASCDADLTILGAPTRGAA